MGDVQLDCIKVILKESPLCWAHKRRLSQRVIDEKRKANEWTGSEAPKWLLLLLSGEGRETLKGNRDKSVWAFDNKEENRTLRDERPLQGLFQLVVRYRQDRSD